MNKLDAIFITGGRIAGEFAREAGTDIKAMIRIGGRSLIERVVSAIAKCELIENQVAVGPVGILDANLRSIQVLPDCGNGIANVCSAVHHLGQLGSRNDLLICATDLPFISSHAINDFIETSEGCGLAVPYLTATDWTARYPDSPAAFVHLREGEFTTGSVIRVSVQVLMGNVALMERAFASRKSDLRMAQILGPYLCAKFLTKSLSIVDITKRAEKVLGCRCKAVLGSADLAFDIDNLDEYGYAKKYESSRLK